MKEIKGGVCAAKGFKASAYAAGIKYQGRTDMAMLYSEEPCTVAGTFTTNIFKAAPVVWDRDIVYNRGRAQAVVVNSGIANACTGEEGMDCARHTAQAAAEALGLEAEDVFLGSTGVIGMQLPVEKLKAGARALAEKLRDGEEAANEAARAIMTTDTHEKEIAYELELGGNTVHIGGMSKGSGMIHPNMCTMLGYITTDAAISQNLLQKILSDVVVDTFNMISVDGDTSTNDTLLIMANGMAGNKQIDSEGENYDLFRDAVYAVCLHLAKEMAADGEGATKLVECTVRGADTKDHARTLAKSVICSSLTKAAMYGCDANWGRELCALGYSGVTFDPDKVDMYFRTGDHELLIFTHGMGTGYSEEEASQILSADHVEIIADMHMGEASAVAYGCDLTYDYVKINADYRS
ncbi:MAG: bifunctional glutamate N-acetyltransferase/amino-acid acetyltransferase ArgJ [Lachnospiraceae bacterium]|nr:bifunctional glutamate N-acetyltransferase/amino-acid acetyltransferase ArgJ [Lachnospiraceae bacterium]